MKISILSAAREKPFTCSACGKSIPSPFGAIGDAPAILGCSQNTNIEQDKFIDFQIYVCHFCGLIQTDARLDSESYETVHSYAVGGIWTEHGNKLAEFISECLGNRLAKLENALEIGPSVSPILKRLSQAIPFIQYVDLMNGAPFELTPNEHYEKLPFPSTQLEGKFDLIVASHVIEHAESLYGFMEAIKHHLKVNGFAILSTPNFHEWMTKKYWNAITSEHLNYPFIKHLQGLCIRLGLSVEFAYFKAHSVFIQVSYSSTDTFSNKSSQGRDRDNTRQILEDWIIEINSNIAKYEAAIGDTAQEVILAGASHLSQYVVLISERIRSRARFVLDNASDKHGMRLYGTELTAQPFDIVKRFQAPIVIVPPSPYVDEMIAQILDLNPNAQVIS
jgi:SAM-dependent methyltransferase